MQYLKLIIVSLMLGPLAAFAQAINPAIASSLMQGNANASVLGASQNNPLTAGKIDASALRELAGDTNADPTKNNSALKKQADGRLDNESLRTNVPNSPNAFQTFIVQSTGRSLPIYGQNLFNLSN